MDFEKSHIDNKGFGGENLSINHWGFEPLRSHSIRNHAIRRGFVVKKWDGNGTNFLRRRIWVT